MDHDYTKYRELKENDVVLILGAFWGDYIIEKHGEIKQKNCYIINVEPNFELAARCLKTIQELCPNNACVLNICVYDRPGFESFENKEIHGVSTISGINTQYSSTTEYISSLPTVTLDQLLPLFKIDKIFCDIEGAELEVFLNSDLIRYIDYIAIAAYHERDGEQTHIKLKKYFDEKISDVDDVVIVDIDENRMDGTVLYFIKNGGCYE